MTVYAPAIPGFTAMALAPWFTRNEDAPLAAALIGFVPWMIIFIPLVIGMKSRRYWGVVLYFYVGVFCAVALPFALAIMLILLLIPAHLRPPEFFYIWFGVGLVAMIPFWPMLVRALRLKYWQPWTTPDQWEVGDERIADWVFDAAGVPRRPPLEPVPRSRPAAPAKPRSSRRRR